MIILDVRNITKFFGNIKAVNSLSLKIEKGKIYSLIGPNGAGKTTFFDIIAGIIWQDSGNIYLHGNEISNLPIYQRAKHFSRTFQLTRNFQNLSLKDNLLLAFESEFESFLKFIFYQEKQEKEKLKLIYDFLQQINFSENLEKSAAEISYGQAKLLELARAILKDHDLLLLDEPVAGVNPNLRQIIKQIILNLKELGDTVFLIEHDLNFVMEISDYIFVMAEGQLISEGNPSVIKKDPRVLAAYLGEANA
jgi:branched-chain amino acid transport system ATP-binding protein